jgi:ElaB/YqjD/DUF883 family membrane-anchored ribosome-binding protein
MEMPKKTEEVAGKAGDAAREAAGKAQDTARQAAGEARGRVREQVDQRSTQIGEQVASSAGDVRSVAQQLREQGKDTPARYVDQAAERAERLGGYLRDSDSDTILNDVEGFARRNPWAIAAGGLALGFVASRMLKASSTERYQSSFGDGYGRSSLPARTGGQTVTGGAHGTRPSSFEPHV